MAPKSLAELCRRTAIKNISHITSIGDMSYHLAKPILARVQSAAQLHEIEENCPHIYEDAVELWKRFIQRDFAKESELKNYAPKNPRSWHKVYFKYKREKDAEVAEAEARMTEQFDALKRERARNETVILKPSEVPSSMRQSTIAGGGPRGRGGVSHSHSNNDSVLSWGGGSRTKLTSGQSVLRRARREAAEVARRNAISGQLQARAGQITRAPRAMVNEHRIAHNRSVDGPPPPRVLAPVRHRSTAGGLLASGRSEMEARLIRAQQDRSDRTNTTTAPRPMPKPAVRKAPVTEVSDEEDGDDLGLDFTADDTLFGITPPGSKTGSASNTSRKSLGGTSSSRRRAPSPLALDDDDDDADLFGERRPPSTKARLPTGGASSSSPSKAAHRGAATSPPPPRRMDVAPVSPPKPAARAPSPPALAGSSSAGGGGPGTPFRKRKAVDIFMPVKKRAR